MFFRRINHRHLTREHLEDYAHGDIASSMIPNATAGKKLNFIIWQGATPFLPGRRLFLDFIEGALGSGNPAF